MELLDLYIQQDTVLNAMEEGLIASDRNGTIVFALSLIHIFKYRAI